MRIGLLPTAASLALCLALAAPAGAAEPPAPAAKPAPAAPAEPGLRGDIDGFLQRLEKTTHGFVKWDGAERFDLRREGAAEIADIVNARIAIGAGAGDADATRLILDHVTIRRTPGPDNSQALAFVLPHEARLQAPKREEILLTLQDAAADAVVDAQSGRARATTLSIAGARLDDKKTGDWITLGPLALSSKLAADAAGGWATPIEFSLQKIAFAFTEAKAGGAIERIAYSAETRGPDLAALNLVRDKLEALRRNEDIPPDAQLDELLDLLPKMYALFSLAKGELTIEGMVVRPPQGDPYLTLAKASLGGVLSGLAGDTAAWRVTLKHEGLALAPGVVDPDRVPQRAIVDFGVENVATAALHKLLEAALTMRAGASDADKAKATQQMIGAAAMLNPVVRLYELAVELPKVGVEATAEAKGSPLSPAGYGATGDVAVRGFAALAGLVGDMPVAPYLPLLKEIGAPGVAADGSPRLKFHLASALAKWLTINDSDVSAWLAGDGTAAGGQRNLHPAAPPLNGADVRAVQAALAKAGFPAPQSGAYDAATAVAVAHFQKQNGLNVDGVVDHATRQKLGVAPEPGPPAGPNPALPKKGPN